MDLHGIPLDIDHFAVDSADIGDPNLVCGRCTEAICTIEHGDDLAVLVATAVDHFCTPDTDTDEGTA
ncbi:hypothetical protein [Streptacidiphilus cavernicola]|uniref:FxLD family lantipeptide n=1 Tax=Streptacidiphilus cavernicola TaxID=3342716 RepID=A0ABV6VYE2_9ACTN